MNLVPMFDGRAVNVRLITGTDILCVAYDDPDEDRMILECPLVVSMKYFQSPDGSDVIHAQASFVKWMPMVNVNMFPIWNDQILVLAPLTEPYASYYAKWSVELYGESPFAPSMDSDLVVPQITLSHNGPILPPRDEDLPDTNDSRDSKLDAYWDYHLQNFVPTGKPN